MTTTVTEDGIFVWRMSAPGDGRSMWYDRDGRFDPIDPAVEVLPMPIDQRRLTLDESGTWLSSVSAPGLLDVWFPEGLQARLEARGFVVHRFFARHWVNLPNEVVFRLDTANELEPDADSGDTLEISGTYCLRCGEFVDTVSVHASDCSVHNEPAMPAGSCDCDLAAEGGDRA